MKHILTTREWDEQRSDSFELFHEEEFQAYPGIARVDARNHLERMKREDPAKYADRLREWEW